MYEFEGQGFNTRTLEDHKECHPTSSTATILNCLLLSDEAVLTVSVRFYLGNVSGSGHSLLKCPTVREALSNSFPNPTFHLYEQLKPHLLLGLLCGPRVHVEGCNPGLFYLYSIIPLKPSPGVGAAERWPRW